MTLQSGERLVIDASVAISAIAKTAILSARFTRPDLYERLSGEAVRQYRIAQRVRHEIGSDFRGLCG